MTDQLGPDFDRRLKAGLDRFDGPTPLPEGARFARLLPPRRHLGPVKPALALAAALAVLLVAASALAGGPDPSTWTQKAVSSFQSVTRVQPAPSPISNSTPRGRSQPPARTAPSQPKRQSPEASDGSRAEPPDSHGPSPSPDSGHHDSSAPSPSPSPGEGSDQGGRKGYPSPTPSGRQP